MFNSLVMYDQETETLWSQFLGQGVAGPLGGYYLNQIASQLTAWDDWKNEHPDTTAIDNEGAVLDSYSFYYTSSQLGLFGPTYSDERIGQKEFVVGVVSGQAQKAYPFRHLSGEEVLNDSVGGRDILVTFDQEMTEAAVFSRRIEDRVFTFRPSNNSELMEDSQTGTVWDKITGESVEGPLLGAQLTRLPSTQSFWFAWHDFYPDAEFFIPAEQSGK